MAVTQQFWGGLALAALLASAAPRDHTSELQARFARETNPVHKAKLMQKLGADEFRDIERYAANSQFSLAAAMLHQYHQEAEEASQALDEAGLNAEKKPSGFKQLQFSVRDSLGRLDRIISTLTVSEQTPFRRDRDSLEKLNSHLLHELFPREKNHYHPRHHRFPFP